MKKLSVFLAALLILGAFLILGAGCEQAPREFPDSPVRVFAGFGEDSALRNAVCYGPHRDGQHPDGPHPTAAQLREDLDLMAPHWKMMRIYNSATHAETLLQVIAEDGRDMKVVLGMWVAPEAEEANRAELEAAVRLANAYPDIVVAVCVGNETQVDWSAHRSPLDRLIEYVREVRRRVKVPVTVADDYNFWNKPESRTLAAQVDFITLHAHPMWNGLQREDALAWLQEQCAACREYHPERPVLIGETGWATSVADHGEQAKLIKGVPGEAEQALFYDEVRDWVRQEPVTVFIFEAFDENWKGGDDPVEVEKHWGVFRADRTAKVAVGGGLSD